MPERLLDVLVVEELVDTARVSTVSSTVADGVRTVDAEMISSLIGTDGDADSEDGGMDHGCDVSQLASAGPAKSGTGPVPAQEADQVLGRAGR